MGAVSNTMHVDKLLTNMIMGYKPDGFIGGTLFPEVPVQKQADLYMIWDRARVLR